MYSAVLRNGKTVGWYFNEPPDTGAAEKDYMSVAISSEETEMARRILREGYSYIERGIVMEIPINSFQPAVRSGKKFAFSVVEDWQPEEVFNVAKESFETDYRFAFGSEQENKELKNDLLHSFITELMFGGITTIATYLCQEGRLEGFNIWNVGEGTGQILLGAVSSKYRNSGIALPLYSYTVEAMKERGANTLRNVVASSNRPSLNLHAILARCAGGVFRFGCCQDFYQKGPPQTGKQNNLQEG